MQRAGGGVRRGDPAAGAFEARRGLIQSELRRIERLSGGELSRDEALSLLSFVVGALVVGAFVPDASPGFAARAARDWLDQRGVGLD